MRRGDRAMLLITAALLAAGIVLKDGPGGTTWEAAQ